MNVSTIRNKFAVLAAAAVLCPLLLSGTVIYGQELHGEVIRELSSFQPVREYMQKQCPSVIKSWSENPKPQAAVAELWCRINWTRANKSPSLYPADEREAKTNKTRMKKLLKTLDEYVGNITPGLSEAMERAGTMVPPPAHIDF